MFSPLRPLETNLTRLVAEDGWCRGKWIMYKVQTSRLNFFWLWCWLAWITCCCYPDASSIILSGVIYLLVFVDFRCMFVFLLHLLYVGFFANLFLYAIVALCQMSMHSAVRPFLVILVHIMAYPQDGRQDQSDERSAQTSQTSGASHTISTGSTCNSRCIVHSVGDVGVHEVITYRTIHVFWIYDNMMYDFERYLYR